MTQHRDSWCDEFPTDPGWYWRLSAAGLCDIVEIEGRGEWRIGRDVYGEFTDPDVAAERGERFRGPLAPPPIDGR